MEEWQIEVISKNLPRLIELTNCSTELLARLESCQILGTNDIQKIKVPGLTRSQQTGEFYKIIITRQNSFETLLKALKETCQSGALGILSGESFFDDTQISYDVYSELGQGSYGTMVCKGKIGERTVAVKMVHSNLMGGVQALHEVNMLKDCDAHENVVRYFGAKRVGMAILIALELCDMSLKDWIEKKYEDIPPVEVLRQMTTGLEWLHSQKIVHREIKPENVLIIREIKRVKLSDFGLSRLNSFGATMAPEILTQVVKGSQTHCEFTYASDVLSLGCVYYYVLSDGKLAFGDAIRCQVNILDGKSMIEAKEIQHGCSQNILFINLMILQDPKSRPTCTNILSYPLLWSQNDRIRFIDVNAKELLKQLNQLNMEGKHARVLEIVKEEDLCIIKRVLEGIEEELDITGVWGEEKKSLLHVAVARGDDDVVEFLLHNAFKNVISERRFDDVVPDYIMDIYEIDADAFTQKCRILELLFTKAPHLIESKRDDGYTPLHVAIEGEFVNGKQVEFIEMLLSHNANLNEKESNWGNTPLHLLFNWDAIIPENAVEIILLLITHNANPDALICGMVICMKHLITIKLVNVNT